MVVYVNADIGADTFAQPGHKVKAKIRCQASQHGKCQYPANGGIEFMQLLGIHAFVDGQFDALAE